MVQDERYYEYMGRRLREEDKQNYSFSPTENLMRQEIIEMQKSIHALQMRIKELAEENRKMKEQNANLHNN